jgi:hypothetical protein
MALLLAPNTYLLMPGTIHGTIHLIFPFHGTALSDAAFRIITLLR